MDAHKAAMTALDTLQYQTSHALTILEKNGFMLNGMHGRADAKEAALAVYNGIDRLKQIVLLDGYEVGEVTVSS